MPSDPQNLLCVSELTGTALPDTVLLYASLTAQNASGSALKNFLQAEVLLQL